MAKDNVSVWGVMMTEVTLEGWIALGTAIMALIGFLTERFYYDTRVSERISAIETNVGRMETKVDLFWGALEAQLPGMLLKGNPIPADSQVAILLKKFQAGPLTKQEMDELACALECEAKNPDHLPGEVLAIVLMSATVKAKVGMQNDKACDCE
jgi:hypothetical protein